MKITDLKPEIVWKFFHEVTQVPRPSKKEEKIIKYLEGFAEQYNVLIKKDEAGNILMFKPATPGYEKLPTVILQSHMDMVCEKNSDKEFDFDNDPIETVVDGDWLRANGTTLGADNGIGMAAELAILASDDIEHGPIECLFTVDEETGLTGAKALEKGFMNGEILLNLDSEDEGELFIGCAGGKDTQASFTYEPVAAPEEMLYFKITVSGLNGGHSGGDIHKGLGNANKLLVRYLYLLMDEDMPFALATIDGGNLRNAIAREANAVIGLQPSDKEKARVLLNTFAADVENELKHADPNVKLTMESADRPATAIDAVTTLKVILSMHACPHGVIAMSHDIEGLVETSTNLASVKMKEGNTIVIGTSQRSSINSSKLAIANTVKACFEMAGADVTQGDGYPGWTPNPNSQILKVAEASYERLFGKKAKIMAIHAGLECGLFLEKYPYLDMISFGPTLQDVHSPAEKILIPTVELWWQHLLDTLKSIPAK
ncbi:dipeptidase D [Parabacteroides sp. PFB2-12]|uniref:aminoacyl-histidine dipeptidase n=1 Tax=Parabacteroides sp. PFB2-12 TaxID=2940652 RepID=UPI002474C26A|nr:aminoacyl-histidine dipeptidase [Parabacteroides sp. PFB2-12]MDH6389283.1 dipeptidase D [Parabacteroides sp. PFB2-12]